MRRMSVLSLMVALLVLGGSASAAPANPAVLSISMAAGGGVPLFDSSTYFKQPNFNGAVSFDLSLPAFLPAFLSLKAEAGIGLTPTLDVPLLYDKGPQGLSGAGGLAATWRVAPWLSVGLDALAGYYYAWVDSGSGLPTVGDGGFMASAGTLLAFDLGEYFSLGLRASYLYEDGYYQGLATYANLTAHIPFGPVPHTTVVSQPTKPQKQPPATQTAPAQPEPLKAEPTRQQSSEWLDVSAMVFDSIYPVFYKHYAEAPIGSVLVKNAKDSPMQNVTVSLWINKFMDTPMQIKGPSALAPSQEQKVDLPALFNDKVLEITEATKVAVELTFQYSLGGQTYQQKKSDTVTIYDRNALTWGSDDKKVCAFMSEKDPAVMSFSKNVGAIVKTKGNTALNVNLLSAMAMHQALLLYGLAYVPDPKTPYASKTNESVDLLQYPRQTFEYRSGDCDDLTILFCSLLEAIGIETAAITVPGHIFMAFAVGVSPDEVRKTYLHPDDFIFSDGKSWIPVEITERTGGFLLAWQEGAQEWRENVARQQANFILVHDGWNTYQPVGLPGLGQGITVPAAADIAKSFQAEMERFVDNEISLRAAKIQADIKKAETAKLDNSLGVLYGRYGLMDRAENAFQRALGKEEYVPTLLNLANIAFSKKEMDKALGFCDRASKNAPDSPQVLLAVARVNHAMENYGSVSKAYARLKALDPVLAEQFAYLDLRGSDAQKAADVSNAGVLVWAE